MRETVLASPFRRPYDFQMPLIAIFFSSLLTTLLTHGLVMGDLTSILHWARQDPMALLFTWFALASAILWLTILMASARFPIFIFNTLLLAIATISFLKKEQFGRPLYPWDFELSHEVLMVLPSFLKSSPWVILVVFSTCALAFAIFLKIPKGSFRPRTGFRSLSGLALTATLAFVFLANNPLHDFLFKKYFSMDINRPQDSFRGNSLLISFILMKEQGEVYPPSNYTEKRFNELASLPPFLHDPQIKDSPDIVVVMSESFFDPLQLSGIHWKQDPLAFTRSLAPDRPLSLTVVPTFGGRTGNAEFEFLTGFSTSFFARGTVPYLKLIDAPQTSLARTLRDVGYRSIAIHPGGRGAYNREQVYTHFGFDFFYSVESFHSPKNYGNQISDESLLPMLKESLTKQMGPSFHFIVTIQNHYPYNPNPFDLKNLDFDPTGLGRDEQVVLNYYSQLLKATDRFHQNLIAYLKTRQRPTVLLIFGDHLPPLLPEFGLFKNHFIHAIDPDQWTREEKLKMFSTPYVQWSNFPLPREEKSIQASSLGVRLLKNLGLPLNSYQHFVWDFSQRWPIFRPELLDHADPLLKKELNDYQIFQYGIFTHQPQYSKPQAVAPLNPDGPPTL